MGEEGAAKEVIVSLRQNAFTYYIAGVDGSQETEPHELVADALSELMRKVGPIQPEPIKVKAKSGTRLDAAGLLAILRLVKSSFDPVWAAARVDLADCELDGIDISPSCLDQLGVENELRTAILPVADEAETGLTLGGINLEEARLENANLTGAWLAGAHLAGAWLRFGILDRAQMSRADLSGATLLAASLRGTWLNDADLRRAYLQNADFSGATTRMARFASADISLACFDEAQLTGADFQHAVLSQAKLREAKLDQAILREAMLTGADLSGSRLVGAVLENAWLGETLLRGADLSVARLEGARMTEAQMQGANLLAAKLHGSVLFAANLAGARLEAADLTGVDLREVTDLRGVRLHNAHLEKTWFYLNQIAPIQDEVDATRGQGSYRAAMETYLALKANFLSLGSYEDAARVYIKEQQMDKAGYFPTSAGRRWLASALPQQPPPHWWSFSPSALRYRLHSAWRHLRLFLGFVPGEVNEQMRAERNRWHWARSWLYELLTGYGERPQMPVLWSVVILVAFFLTYWGAGNVRPGGWLNSLTHSVAAFATVGFNTLEPVGWGGRLLTAAESILGIGFFALLIYTLGNRMSRS